MTRPDPLQLLAQADPAARLGEEVELSTPPPADVLQRIIASPRDAPPGAFPPRRRSPLRRVAIGACAALALLAVVVAGPLAPSSVDVVAEAQEAIGGPDAILHYTTQWRSDDTGEVLTEAEVWEDLDGNRTREILTGPDPAGAVTGTEIVRSQGGVEVFEPGNDELRVVPRAGDRPLPVKGAPIELMGIGDLSTLLRRARDGEIEATELGKTTLRGTSVYQLRLGREPVPCRELPASRSGIHGPARGVIVFIAADDYRPIRVELQHCRGPIAPVQVVDYVGFERLERTAENQKLLEMSPHPGAERIVEAD